MSVQPVTIVTNAFKLLGVYQASETPRAADAADGFARLNIFVNGLGAERLTMNGIQKFSLPVVSGHNPYTIGVGGDFNINRPNVLDDVTLTLSGTTPTDIPVPQLNQDDYANLSAKTITAQISSYCYYNATYDITTPLGGLYTWPILSDTTLTINLWVAVPITEFATPTTTYTLLPMWQRMLETNLACEIAALSGVQVPPLVAQQATSSMQLIKTVNTQPGVLSADPGLLKSSAQTGGGNWLSGPALLLATRIGFSLFHRLFT